jgi:ferredoxin
MSRRPDGITESIRIRVHPGLCEAWGNCHRWAPDIYPLHADGTIDLHVIEVPPERAVEAWMGAEACPARVISIVAITPVELGTTAADPSTTASGTPDTTTMETTP